MSAGVQGDEIGDVKFNGDGDGVGRYSVYQYQHIANETNSKYNTRLSGRYSVYQYQHIANGTNSKYNTRLSGRYSVYQYQHIANGPNSKYNMRQSGALQRLPVPAHG
jgi:hypothetical protein